MEGSHDAIIEPAECQLVQIEIQRRKNTGRSHNCCSPFSAKLKCGDCGSIDAEMEAVSNEMEVTVGLIRKLVDENASRYAAFESRMDSLEKERERKEIDDYRRRIYENSERRGITANKCAFFIILVSRRLKEDFGVPEILTGDKMKHN